MSDRMTRRERVKAALEHKPVDRTPLMWWLNPHTVAILASKYKPGPIAFQNWLARRSYRAMNNRKLHPDLRDGLALLLDPYGHTDYALALGADLIDALMGDLKFWYKGSWFEKGRLRIKDGYGATRRIVGIFLEVEKMPIRTIKDLETFQFPDPSNPALYDPIRAARKNHPDTFINAMTLGVQDITANWFMGIENFYAALIDYPDEIQRFFDRLVEHSLQIARGSILAGADSIMILDDYGHQTGPFISMKMWREFTYPCLKRQIAEIKNMGAYSMLHSCGHQMPFLQYYAEAGLDGLQAFQFAAGNDFAKAKQEFGDKLCFFTGMDVQMAQTRTPQEIRDDAIRAWKIGREGSGFVLASTHNIQPVTPLENIVAMIEVANDIQAGKIA